MVLLNHSQKTRRRSSGCHRQRKAEGIGFFSRYISDFSFESVRKILRRMPLTFVNQIDVSSKFPKHSILRSLKRITRIYIVWCICSTYHKAPHRTRARLCVNIPITTTRYKLHTEQTRNNAGWVPHRHHHCRCRVHGGACARARFKSVTRNINVHEHHKQNTPAKHAQLSNVLFVFTFFAACRAVC